MRTKIAIGLLGVVFMLTAGCIHLTSRGSPPLGAGPSRMPRYVWYVQGMDPAQVLRYDVGARSSQVVLGAAACLEPSGIWPTIGLSWDGERLIYSDGGRGALVLVDIASGKSEGLPVTGLAPMWFMGTHKIIFSRRLGRDEYVVSVYDLHSNREEKLLDGKGMLLSVSDSGQVLLARWPEAGGVELFLYDALAKKEMFVARAGIVNCAGISPDGKRVFIADPGRRSSQVPWLDAARIRVIRLRDNSQVLLGEPRGIIPNSFAAWAGNDALVFVGTDVKEARACFDRFKRGLYDTDEDALRDLTQTVYVYSLETRRIAKIVSGKGIWDVLPSR